jgi:hypothetical protein
MMTRYQSSKRGMDDYDDWAYALCPQVTLGMKMQNHATYLNLSI